MSEPYSNFVPIETFNSPTEAHILKGALEAEGIESVILGEDMNDVFPVSNTLLGGVRLMVHKDNYERARQLIDTNKANPTEEN